ncbi:MAG: hypothetical protein IJC92_03570 [Bacteroidaceae bacterium]|nr:hypothetical protein [Bacteroidaceae bacterium]
MKEIKLRVSHKNIEQRILLYTYYTGEARKEVGLPERLVAKIQASSDDETQLADHIKTAITELGTFVSQYFTTCHCEEINDEQENEKIYQFTTRVPENFPRTALGPIEESMESYIVKRTLQQWLQQHRPEESGIPASEAQTLTYQLRELFTRRIKPCIESEQPNNIIEL